LQIHPLVAIGVFLSTAATDAVYVFFNAAVSAKRRLDFQSRQTGAGLVLSRAARFADKT